MCTHELTYFFWLRTSQFRQKISAPWFLNLAPVFRETLCLKYGSKSCKLYIGLITKTPTVNFATKKLVIISLIYWFVCLFPPQTSRVARTAPSACGNGPTARPFRMFVRPECSPRSTASASPPRATSSAPATETGTSRFGSRPTPRLRSS